MELPILFLWGAGIFPMKRCPGKNAIFCQFFYSKQQEVPGTPAGRPLFVAPGGPGTPGVPTVFLKFMCLLLSRQNWEKLNRGFSKPGCFPLFSGKGPDCVVDPFRDCSS